MLKPKRNLLVLASLLLPSVVNAQLLDVRWAAGTCTGVCSSTAGYNIYVDNKKYDVKMGTPVFTGGYKAMVDLLTLPTSTISVTMTAYDAYQVESVRSGAITVAPSDWPGPAATPLLKSIKPIIVP